MRSRLEEPTIGVSCGHRVPRVPVPAERGNVYWCEACGKHRMSGGRCTGERGFDFLLELRDEIALHDVECVFEIEPPARTRAVVEALGARVVVTSAAG